MALWEIPIIFNGYLNQLSLEFNDSSTEARCRCRLAFKVLRYAVSDDLPRLEPMVTVVTTNLSNDTP